jgi:hypothetical protein
VFSHYSSFVLLSDAQPAVQLSAVLVNEIQPAVQVCNRLRALTGRPEEFM